MQKLFIPGTDVETTRFIFGTGSIMRVGTQKRRHRLLAAALDNGFLHFDTAPYYGYGVAERDLGVVLRGRSDVRITTKVGIYSPGGEAQSSTSVLARKLLGKVFRPLVRPQTDFSLSRAQSCLDQSLRRLGREQIDLYLLHEPQTHLLQTQEWQKWLESCKQQGKIRRCGLALTAAQLRPFLSAGSPLADVVQVLDSLEGREADLLLEYGRAIQITFGYISQARSVNDRRPISALLRAAIERNPRGPIIVSTTKAERLGQFAQLSP